MSTCNSPVLEMSNSPGEFIQTLEQSAVPLVQMRGCHGAVMREKFERRLGRFSVSLCDCWRRMRVMKAAFEDAQSGDGAGSRERGEQRLRDEEAWSRMDDEGSSFQIL